MNKHMRTMTTAAGALVVAAASLLAAPPANAAGPVKCSAAGISTVCINDDPDGYRASVTPWYDLANDTLDFNLWCANGTWYGDEGSFVAEFGKEKSYIFKVGRQGSCFVRLLNRSTGEQWDTPSISR
ncbi:hypothetical protein [Wenjunlia tyrosinilytica]|uniref:Secreted protein n=1 Tax=Wenjunlia tyrosinilytica TaxID=1544741 RepID=A0A918E0H3_9ACTN|nr:hypothetical protein [Wenjunlia tyrosinilytica]GGO93240.1 hypothetical protein GCM10012280_45310 [Wenjunlia tyrosinilytica]